MQEEIQIRNWMEASPENRKLFLEERQLFDAMILLADEDKIRSYQKKNIFIGNYWIKEVMKMIRVQRKSKEVSVYNATQILKQNDYLKKNLQKKQKEYEKYAEKEKQKIVKLQEKADKVWERWAE